MNKVLFFARDPAGANVIIPLIKRVLELHAYETVIYGKEFALDRIKREGLRVTNICDEMKDLNEESVYAFLKKISPDIIVTGTSLNDFTERYLWKAAQSLGIFSCCIVDQWINLGIRFSKYDYSTEEQYKEDHDYCYLPSTIYVIDEFARKMIVNEGVQGDLIEALGSPHFDVIKQKFISTRKLVEVERESNEKRVIFASEPISIDYGNYWGLTEKTSFDMLYKETIIIAEKKKCNFEIVIRPHPREDINNWRDVVEHNKSKRIKVVIDKETDSFELMSKCDLVCGMSSMFLIEAAVCEVPIVSIMKGLRQENPFILDKLGACRSVMSCDELNERLENALFGKLEKMCIEFEYGATDRIWNNINERVKK